MTRSHHARVLGLVSVFLAASRSDAAVDKPEPMGNLPAGIRSRFVDNHNSLRMHVLEAGFESEERPCVLLLHGFPELAYSWRKVMLPLAAAGYHVVAPDQRGYGRTTGADLTFEADLAAYKMLNLVRDTVGLISALGRRQVHLVGHDAGSAVAAWCALLRSDLAQSVTMMSSPFAGPPSIPFATADGRPFERAVRNSIPAISPALGELNPPRMHYQWYYTTREANGDLTNAPQGLHAFLRGYYHHKSADWAANQPFRLEGWTAAALAQMPTYYVMKRDETMAETVAAEMPSAAAIAACAWLPDDELQVYASEYRRTGFQGGLNWYRARLSGKFNGDLEVFSGRTITVPACYISGKSDWGNYQFPGSFERMSQTACAQMLGVHLVEGAGHWVQQERPAEVSRLLLQSFRAASERTSGR